MHNSHCCRAAWQFASEREFFRRFSGFIFIMDRWFFNIQETTPIQKMEPENEGRLEQEIPKLEITWRNPFVGSMYIINV